MKKLIFPLITLLSFNTFAQGEMDGPLGNNTLKKKFVTEVKEMEISRIMKGTKEFQECREKNKFEPTLDDAKRAAQLQKANECFQDKLKNVKGDELMKLSQKLELESYGIVKSKNSADVSKYLSRKMAIALTGHNPDETDPNKIKESRKWKNQKVLDQSMFLNLYQAQLAKSALLEISRFCFQNLRREGDETIGTKTFQEYWNNTITNDPTKLTDLPKDQFPNIKIDQDLSKTDEVYKTVQDSIGTADINPKFMNDFLTVCMSSIKVMCDDFKKGIKATGAQDGKVMDEEEIKTDKGAAINLKRGSNSCLTVNRMASLRKAVTQTDKVVKEMEKLNSEEEKLNLIIDANMFVPGQNGAASIDELTSASGHDMIAEMSDDDAKAKREKCQKNPNDDDCEQYLQDGDSYYKALHGAEMEMNLKREVARKQLKELQEKQDKQKIEEWLAENGFATEAEEYKKDPSTWTEAKLDDLIIKTYEARKQAEIETLKKKVGSRQMKEKDGKDTSDTDRSAAVTSAVEDSHQERARLAQVVMFNNIITSYLDVKKDNKSVGRNVTGLKKEMQAMEQSGASGAFFENIKETVSKEDKGATKDSNISGLDIIDVVLGKSKDEKKP